MTEPQKSYYCADGEIHHAYKSIEDGDKRRYVSYPWWQLIATKSGNQPFGIYWTSNLENRLTAAHSWSQ